MTLSRKIAHDILVRWPFVDTIRHRLRCPRCAKVGTWKPRGPVIRESSPAADVCGGYTEKVQLRFPGYSRRARNYAGYVKRRWLCKWCGLYDGQDEDDTDAFVDPERRVWSLIDALTDQETAWLPLEKWTDADPWAG